MILDEVPVLKVMDVLSPELLWIDGRCYRVPILDPALSGNIVPNLKDCDLEAGNGMDFEDTYDDCDVPDIEIEQNGRYCMKFPVPKSFLPFIIGSKGATVRRISNSTSCTVIIPKFSDRTNIIAIYGPTKNQVILAWKNIVFIITSSRKKLSVTHFVSIPVNSEEIKENFIKFKRDVLSSCHDQGITEKLFQEPSKLHLTVVVLILVDDKERKQAEEKFLEVCNQIVKPMLLNVKPCVLEVAGLDIMNDDPSEVRVLYGNVYVKDNKNFLQDLCIKIRHAFSLLGFSKAENIDPKLHVTLMNVSFLKRDEEEIGEEGLAKVNRNDRISETFNASDILKKYQNFRFGQQELTSIHLSIRCTIDEDGFYKHIAKAEF